MRQLVFSGRGGHFAGMASPAAIIEGFGAHFQPWRSTAEGSSSTTQRTTANGRSIVSLTSGSSFLENVPAPAVVKAARPRSRSTAPPSSELAQSTLEVERTIQVVVREELLESWLGERIVTPGIRTRESQLTMAQVQQIVDSLLPDVPVEMQPATKLLTSQTVGDDVTPVVGGPDGEDPTAPLLLVVDRDVFGLAIAREWVLAALPRNRAR